MIIDDWATTSAPSRGAPTAFMAAPVIDQGIVIAVLIAQLSVQEVDNVVTGDRHWRQDGFGATMARRTSLGPTHFTVHPARQALRGI